MVYTSEWLILRVVYTSGWLIPGCTSEWLIPGCTSGWYIGGIPRWCIPGMYGRHIYRVVYTQGGVYAQYTLGGIPRWCICPVYHPGYTLPIHRLAWSTYPSTRSQCRRGPGLSLRETPWVGDLPAPLGPPSCYRWYTRLRRVACSLPSEIG